MERTTIRVPADAGPDRLAVARFRSQITPGPPAVLIFTTLLLIVTLLNLEAFDFDLVPVWVWTGSYVVYPLLGVALILWTRGRTGPPSPGPSLTIAARRVLQVQAGFYGVIGVLLLVAREVMVDAWPWPISNGLAQFYSGPFLAIAWCCWRYSARATLVDAMPITIAMLTFTVATVAVSVRHHSLFSASEVATWVWFAWFGAGAVAAAWLLALLLTARESTQRLR